MEIGLGADAQEAGIKEGLGQRQDHLAIDIMLVMFIGLVADAHRPHAAIALHVGCDALGQVALQGDAVERLDMAAGGLVGQVAQIDEVAFQHVGGA